MLISDFASTATQFISDLFLIVYILDLTKPAKHSPQCNLNAKGARDCVMAQACAAQTVLLVNDRKNNSFKQHTTALKSWNY